MASNVAYLCRLCDVMISDPDDVVGIFSEEGKNIGVAARIVYTLSILVTENDPTSKYICKSCLNHVNNHVSFAGKCHKNNEQIVNSLIDKPVNFKFREEMLNFYKIPVQLLVKHYKNVNCAYSSLIYHLKNKFGLEDTDVYVRNLHSSVRNSTPIQGHNENNAAIANGMSKASLVNGSINGDTPTNTTKVSLNILRDRLKSKPKSADRISMNKNGRKVVAETNGDHNYDTQGRTKPTTNGVNIIHDVITIDDDDDDDDNDDNGNKNNDKNNHQPVKDVGPNKWVMHEKDLNNKSTANAAKRLTKNSKRRRIYVNRESLPVIDQSFSLQSSSSSSSNNVVETDVPNSPQRCISRSSNVSTEEISVTPDIGALNMHPSMNLEEQPVFTSYLVMFPSQPPPATPPPQVLPDTGVHFLISNPELPTVDLTGPEEPTIKPKSLKMKRKIIRTDKNGPPPKKTNCPQELVADKKSKPAIQKSSVKKVSNETSTTKLRPKRASAISAVNRGNKKLNLHKLGIQKDTDKWRVDLVRLNVSHFQCPICLTYFKTSSIRQRHENKYHVSPPESACSSVNTVSPMENKSMYEKLEFLSYFSLGRVSFNGKVVANHKNSLIRLAQSKNFLNAVKIFGNEISTFECKRCQYVTSRMFILWTHIYVNHNTKSDSDSRSNSYCFICDRVLTKRSQLLKHVDKCLIKQKPGENNDGIENDCEEKNLEENDSEEDSVEADCASKTSSDAKYVCDYCKADDFASLSLLEQHLWSHVGS